MTDITVTKEGSRWVARFPFDYATKDLVKACGFRFDGATKTWWTGDASIAAKLQGGDPAEVAARINAAREQQSQAQQASIEQSRAVAADFPIPLSPEVIRRGLDFFPYQKAGVRFALNRPDTLIGDEMGLGKTMQAIGVINADPTIANVLIVCPASLKLNWVREASLWCARSLPVSLANGSFPAGGIVIINYEQVAKFRAEIDATRWDMLVCDESHYLKNPKAQRTAIILGKWDRDPALKIDPIKARRRIFLTGTPILNRPKELWTLVHALDPEGLGKNWKGFHTRYCAGHRDHRGYWDISGASNLDELQGRLRGSIMVRRLKSEVLTELPAKRRQIIAFQAESAEAKAAIAAEDKFVRETEASLNKLKAEVEALSADEASEAYKDATAKLRQAQQTAFTETSRVRHAVALAKVPQVIEHLRDVLEDSDAKLVVFAHHHDVTDQIAYALSQDTTVLKADGRDSIKDRDAAVQLFQNMPDYRVIVCGIMAMGVGHTLTASSHVVFAELDWVPGNLQQAEDRCHRIGQRDSVLVQHLVLDGSMDARMAQMLVEKMGVITQAVDAGGSLPEVEHVAVPVAPPSTQSLAGAVKAPAPTPLPPAQVKAIHDALKLLAGMCDGAMALDGHGFNKMDAPKGHSLASAFYLTDAQARWGMKFVIRYGRQIPPELFNLAVNGRA